MNENLRKRLSVGMASVGFAFERIARYYYWQWSVCN